MIQRVKFTADFVDCLAIPSNGERWISDTGVSGLVIRLSANGNGSKTFYVRKTARGKSVRKALFPASSFYLEYARKKAKQEVDSLLGRCVSSMPLHGWRRKTFEKWHNKIDILTVSDWISICLKYKSVSGHSEKTIHRDEERYFQYVDPSLGDKRIAAVTPSEISECLERLTSKTGQLENLYYFLKFAFEFAGEFHTGPAQVAHFLKHNYSSPYDRSYVQEVKFELTDYDDLFTYLENDQKNFQKAMLIRLCFAYSVTPSKAASFCWDDFTGAASQSDLLSQIQEYNHRNFSTSRFVFPSAVAYKTGHISYSKTYWQETCRKHKLPQISVTKLLKHYDHSGVRWAHICRRHVF